MILGADVPDVAGVLEWRPAVRRSDVVAPRRRFRRRNRCPSRRVGAQPGRRRTPAAQPTRRTHTRGTAVGAPRSSPCRRARWARSFLPIAMEPGPAAPPVPWSATLGDGSGPFLVDVRGPCVPHPRIPDGRTRRGPSARGDRHRACWPRRHASTWKVAAWTSAGQCSSSTGHAEPPGQPGARGAVEVLQSGRRSARSTTLRSPPSTCPGVREVEHRPRKRVEPLAGIAVPVDEPDHPFVQRRTGRAVDLRADPSAQPCGGDQCCCRGDTARRPRRGGGVRRRCRWRADRAGPPSSGVCVLMTRRCPGAARLAMSSSLGRTSQSSQGESLPRLPGSSGVPKASRRQIIWTQVVPDLDRVLTTMSPRRNGKSPPASAVLVR